MLYKYNGGSSLEMLKSYDIFQAFNGTEKDLENLLADNLEELYSESAQLMPIFQERAMQEEPDLCALDKDGNLYIFELKRGKVPGDTTIQVMRYCQTYGQKSYYDLDTLYKKYDTTGIDLKFAHQEAFGLEKPLDSVEFNRKQKLVLVGNHLDKSLIDAVEYWQGRGIDIEYIPYRFYDINGQKYFEFFAKPNDYHLPVGEKKGLLFDTNRSYGENDIWDMFANSKVSAYGGTKEWVNKFNKGDYVLYYHKGYGVVGAGIITSAKSKAIPENEELYFEVELLTPQVKCDDDLEYISPSELQRLLNKNFYFARTVKVPYLSVEEAEKVVSLLKEKYK